MDLATLVKGTYKTAKKVGEIASNILSDIQREELKDLISSVYKKTMECSRMSSPNRCFADYVENSLRSAGIKEVILILDDPYGREKTVTIRLFSDEVEYVESIPSVRKGRNLSDVVNDMRLLNDLIIPYLSAKTKIPASVLAKELSTNLKQVKFS